MKTWKQLSWALILVCLSTCVVFAQTEPAGPAAPAAAPAAAPPAAPAAAPAAIPMPSSLNEAPIVILVGDLTGFLTQAGTVTAMVQPGMNGETLKAMLGMRLQDDALAGFPAGAGILAAAFPKNQMMLIFAEVAPAQIQAYKDTLTAQSQGVDVASGLLVVSENSDGLAVAKKMAAQAKQMLDKEPPSPTVKVTLRASSLLDQMKEEISGGLETLQMLQLQGGAMNLVGMHAFLAGARQTDTLALELVPSAKGAQINLSVTPKANTSLAVYLAAPVGSPADLIKLLPAKGAVRGAGAVNPQALEKFMNQIVDTACKDANVTPADRDTFLSMIKDSTGMGVDAFATDALVPGQSLMTGSSAAHTNNPDQVIAQIERSVQNMKTGSVAKMYEKMGVKMDLQFNKNVRQYKGTQIHQFKMALDTVSSGGLQGQAPEVASMQQAMQKLMGKVQYEMAVVGNVMVYTMGGESADSLIDAAKAKGNPSAKPLVAATVFPGDAKALFDLDGGKLVQSLMSAVMAAIPGGEEAAKEMQAKTAPLIGAQPITAAVFLQGGGVQGKLLVPADFLTKVGQVFATAQPGPGGMGEPGAEAPPQPETVPAPAPAPAPGR